MKQLLHKWKQTAWVLLFLLTSVLGWGQTTIIGWDFNGLSNYGASPLTPTEKNTNVTVGGLTRSGFTTGGTAAGNAWGGVGNGTATFTVKANSGYKLSLNEISPYNVRRSSAGATTGQLSYSIDGSPFTNIGLPITWGTTTTSGGNSQSRIDLSGVSELQNVSAASTITFRIVNTGGGSGGTWYLNNFQTGNDFIVLGSVESLASNTITTGVITGAPFCVDASNTATGTIAYTSTGTYTGTFTAELSDASGSFASPITVGTGASPINITIPVNTPSGMGYKIRVVNNDPSTIGSNSAAFTINNGVPSVSSYNATSQNQAASLSWINPESCFDEMLVVAKASASISGTPTGLETANLIFGSGDAFDGGFVVYKGTTSPQSITNLINGTTYYFKLYVRKGTLWSTGQEVTATPEGVSTTSDFFRTKQSGNWNSTATWESSSDGVNNWINATLTPTSAANTITVLSGHNVTVTAAVTVDQVSVNTNGKIIVNSGQTLTVANGADTFDLRVYGIIENAGTITATGAVNFESGGYYNHTANGGTLVRASWDVNSTCEISGITSATTISNLGSNQTTAYGNLVWNCPLQTNWFNSSGSFDVAGNFTINSTGGGTRGINLVTTSVNRTFNIGGNLEINGARLTLTNNSGIATLNIGGDLVLSNSAINQLDFGYGNSAPNNSGDYRSIINLNGDFYNGASSTILVTNSNYYGKIVFAKNGLQNFNNASANDMNGINYVVNSGSTLKLNNDMFLGQFDFAEVSGVIDCGVSSKIYGSGILTVTNTGTLKTANLDVTDAYKAAVAVTGTVTLASGSKVELNGAAQQFLGINTFSGLTINNASGVKATGNITVNGTLNLVTANPDDTDGALDMVIAYGTYATVSKTEPDNFNSTLEHNNLNSYVLNLGAAATVTGIGDITGKVTRNHTFANNTTYAFSNANMTLNFTDGGNASNLPTKITVIATRGSKGLHVDKDVADNGNPAIGGTAVGRLWQILRSGGQAAARFTVRFPYAESELNSNTEANLVTWDHHLDAPAYAGITPHEHGKTNIDVANNFVELANHSLFYLTTEGSTTNTKYWMLSDQITTNNTWLGAATIPEGQSNWDSTSNWTSGVAPTINGHAVIEPVGVAARNPEFVSGSYSFGSIEIKTGAVVDAGAATITLNSGPATAGNVSGSWLNNGTFNAGTSTVVFNAGVDNLSTLAGNTNFHNVTVNTGKTLRLEQNAVMGIAGILTVDGALNATQFENTLVFNGTVDQTVPASSTDNTTAAYHTLELAGAGVKSFEANPSIQGDFVKSGTSTVTIPTQFNFNGTSAQSIAGFDYNNIDFSNAGTKTFTSNGSLSNAGAITFSGTPGAVDFDGATDNLTFVLKSDASGTARIGNATDWTLIGKVTSERFVPSRRAWRLLTAPIKGTTNTSIFANWQGTNNEGILLWNPNGGGATGLEVGPQSNIFSYNGGWAAVNNTNTTPLFGATQNNAFLVFATGPHGSANITPGADPTTPATATTLRPKGGLITGTVTTTLTANQFQLIGNPYASALDTEALIGSNPDAKIWMLDPTLGSFGGYVTFDGTNWAPSTPVAADKNIQSGQAFFVRSTSTLFSIGETHKVISSSNNWFERDNSASTADKIRVLLYKPEAGNWKLADGVLSVLSSTGNDAVDAADANKISNFNENIAFRNGATNLAIEYRGMPEAGTQQPLRMTGTTAQPYQLRVRTEGYVNSTLQPYLEDTASGTLTAIPTDGSDLIVSFTGIVATTSTPDNRFRIVYPATLGLDDLSTTTVRVYPNPITDGTFSVVLHDATTPAHYSLVNVMGQEVQSGALEALHNTVAVGSLQQGIYLLQVHQEGKVFTTKLILK